MKILHVIGSLSPSTGGPAEACVGLCKELARRGHDVSIYTTAFGQAGTGLAKDVGYPSAIPTMRTVWRFGCLLAEDSDDTYFPFLCYEHYGSEYLP